MSSRIVALCLLLLISADPSRLFASGQEASRGVVEKFLAAEGPPLRAYRARRHLRAANMRFHVAATLDAITEMTPEGGFRYEILGEDGSRYIREKVLRPVLRREEMFWRNGDPERNGLTHENYTFMPEPPVDEMEMRVFIKPRRTDLMLVDGAVFLARDDADLQRVEGRLSKNPSFWTSRVDVVRRYARLLGVRVPIAMESVAHLKVAGRSEFLMTYEYESINGEPVH